MARKAAEANVFDKFQLVFSGLLESLLIERMDINEELFSKFMSDEGFQKVIVNWLGHNVYERMKS